MSMTALETVALYYDAWQNKHGDFSEVPLADDFDARELFGGETVGSARTAYRADERTT